MIGVGVHGNDFGIGKLFCALHYSWLANSHEPFNIDRNPRCIDVQTQKKALRICKAFLDSAPTLLFASP